MVCIHTENQNQGDFYPFVLLEISVLHESPLGHLRYGLTDVPPQPNSPPDFVFLVGHWQYKYVSLSQETSTTRARPNTKK